jgi:NADH-quinone oxidoreductase subunit J
MKTRGGEWVLGLVVGGSLLGLLLQAAFQVPAWRADGREPLPATSPATAARLGMGLLGARVDQLETKDEQTRAGMSGYLLPFEIVSVHLLVVLVGAAYLARPKRRSQPDAADASGTG